MQSRHSLFQGGKFHLISVSEFHRDCRHKSDRKLKRLCLQMALPCVSPGQWVSVIVERCWHTAVEKSPCLWFKVKKYEKTELFYSLAQGRNKLTAFPIWSFNFNSDFQQICERNVHIYFVKWTGCQLCVMVSRTCDTQNNHQVVWVQC